MSAMEKNTSSTATTYGFRNEKKRGKTRKEHILLDKCNYNILVLRKVKGSREGVWVQPRLDTVLVVWLSKRSGSVPSTAVSFLRQRFSSIWSRYSSSCCMGLLFLSFAHSCTHKKNQEILYSLHFQVTHLLTYIITPFDWNVVSDLSPQMRHTSPRKSSTQVQEKMNLPRRQKNEKCVDMSNNIQLQSKACKTPC